MTKLRVGIGGKTVERTSHKNERAIERFGRMPQKGNGSGAPARCGLPICHCLALLLLTLGCVTMFLLAWVIQLFAG
ncbi:hypothetical protein GKC28_05680 [Leisingera sp. ANG59]|nr:hypothetical protein [Leisingera sp. ANG59]